MGHIPVDNDIGLPRSFPHLEESPKPHELHALF
jgi:hypothetical protein